MDLKEKITDFSLRHYKSVTVVMVAITVVLGALIPLIRVDTDPENMLSADEPVRVFHNQTKDRFALSDTSAHKAAYESEPASIVVQLFLALR